MMQPKFRVTATDVMVVRTEGNIFECDDFEAALHLKNGDTIRLKGRLDAFMHEHADGSCTGMMARRKIVFSAAAETEAAQ